MSQFLGVFSCIFHQICGKGLQTLKGEKLEVGRGQIFVGFHDIKNDKKNGLFVL